MPAVATSIFELFKIGPGPSSSHTIGPMAAARHFRHSVADLAPEILARAHGFSAMLYGSLSATGAGHGTLHAIAAGLLDWAPESVDPDAMHALWADGPVPIRIGDQHFELRPEQLELGAVIHDFEYNNALRLRLDGPDGPLLERLYYSVGGGFVRWEGKSPPVRPLPRHPFGSMQELRQALDKRDLSVSALILANEQSETGASEADILAGLDQVLDVMEASVTRGLATTGTLPGPIGLARKAAGLYQHAGAQEHLPERALVHLDAYALAAAEENAAGGLMVTAPTLGAGGVIPAVLHFLKHHHRMPRARRRRALLAAAAIGFLIKHNASIAGAEVGCQGEIGAAASMAAALLADAHGCSIEVTANAAEIALEHHLGLTCDPVQGYVQIPCIERNAMGAVKAYNAYLLSRAEDPRQQKVQFDRVVEAMLSTGRDMSTKYRETSLGGLALSFTAC